MIGLLGLRLRLLLRMNLTGYTQEALGAAPIRFALIVIVGGGLVLAVASLLGSLLEFGLRGSNPQSFLTPALAWGLSAAMVGIFFYALLTLVGTFTYRSDLSLLLLTPLPARLVLAEKLLAISGGFSVLLVVVALPSIVGVGNALHAGPQFFLMTAAIILLLPVPPVSLAMLLIFLALRWVPPNRARGIAAALGFGFSALFYVVTQTVQSGTTALPTFGQGRLDLLPTTWPGHALAATSLGQGSTALFYLGLTVLLALLCGGLAVDRCAHLLVTGWTTYHEVGRRGGAQGTVSRPALRIEGVSPAPPGVPAVWALVGKEWRSLRRDPKLLGQLAYPLFIECFSYYRAFGLPWSATTGLKGHIGFVFSASMYATVTLTAVFLLSILTLPIVNREGHSLYLLSLAPVSVRRIVIAKWAACAVPIILLVEGFLAMGVRVLGLSPGQAIFTGVVLAALVVALAGWLLCVGLTWPRVSSDQSRRQVNMVALMVGPPSAVILCAVVGGFFASVFRDAGPNAAGPIVGPLAIFGLTGAIMAGTLYLAPLLLQRLLTGDRRPI
jgi:ABC-2 type transport system permease protein